MRTEMAFANARAIIAALLLGGLFVCLPARSHAAGLDCPEIGPSPVPSLFTDLQAKLMAPGNSVDLTNEINGVINKLQIEKPNLSYAELTNVIIAAYCPVVANATGISASEKWRRIRQFDNILQQQLCCQHDGSGNAHHRQRPAPACGLP